MTSRILLYHEINRAATTQYDSERDRAMGFSCEQRLKQATDEKIMINYDGKEPVAKIVNKDQVPVELLPTAGEYLDTESDEYSEEIAKFEERIFAV